MSIILSKLPAAVYHRVNRLYNYVEIDRSRNICQYKEISHISKNGKLLILYNNVPFIFWCFHDEQHAQWHKKALQKYRTRKSPDDQNVFHSSSFSDGIVQHCVTVSRWFSHKTAAFYIEQCTSPLLFTTLKSHGVLQTGH